MNILSGLKNIFNPDKRNMFQTIWLVLVLLYDILRAIIVEILFNDYGVSGILYFIFGVVTSIFFAYASFILVESVVLNKKYSKVIFYGIVTALTFFAPDIFVIVVADTIPLSLVIGLIVYLLITTSVTVVSIVKKIKSKKTAS